MWECGRGGRPEPLSVLCQGIETVLGIKETTGRAKEQVIQWLESDMIYWNLKKPKNSEDPANEEGNGSGSVK